MQRTNRDLTKYIQQYMNPYSRSLIRLAAWSAALLPLLSAQAEKNKFYVAGDIGGAVTVDTQLKEFFGPVFPNSEVTFDPGLRLGLRGGYGLTDWLDAEVETGFVANEISSITGALETDASLVNIPLLLNARFHCPYWHRISPYFGGGLGFSSTILSADDLVVAGPIGTTRMQGSTAGVVFAYQAFAGLRFAINDRMGLSVEYHYFATTASEMSASATVGTFSDTVQFGGTATHAATIAFDYRF
jgi:opacity protein-like surface antigen